jgi:GAF domain-containing protein
MQKAPLPDNEAERLGALERLGLLDTEPEARFDSITREATARLQVPIFTISLIDSDREFYKSCQGTLARQGPRDISFCGHAMLAKYLFVVEDTLLDERFKDNPMVIGEPYLRFYAGMALLDRRTHLPVGVLCVKDTKPRHLEPSDVEVLMELAHRAEDELNRSLDSGSS